VPAVHDPWSSDLNATDYRPDLAFAIILDPPETLAIHAQTAHLDVGRTLSFDDCLLEMRHQFMAAKRPCL